MPATGLLALLDDITSILDDVALMTRVAVKKTAGVIGDDLALNADSVTGASPDRELPVVWAVAKGALVNKAILVPVALLISAWAPWLVQPLLLIGGLVLCYEGFEKIWAKMSPGSHAAPEATALDAVPVDPVTWEREKIRGAIRTDFILSAEIVVIALGTMATQPILEQIVALSLVGIGVTALVYGLVGGIVKMDDLGLHMLKGPRERTTRRRMGVWILRGMPWLMRGLSVAGTVAMFLVGGGIVMHSIPPAAHALEGATAAWAPVLRGTVTLLVDGVAGVAAGGVIAGVFGLVASLRRSSPETPHA